MRGKNTREDRKIRRRNKDMKENEAPDTPFEPSTKDSEWSLAGPRKVASEISTFGYGLEIKPYMEELVYRGKKNTSRGFCLHAFTFCFSVTLQR